MVANNYSYDYLYQNYVYRLGLGVTYVGNTSMATIVTDTGGAGVVFVDGSLTVDDSNSLGANDFLMVVVAGNISVGVGTSQMAGVFLTDGDFVVSGDVDSQLVIKGLVYANGDISLGRSYLTGGLNNTSPGVRVEYDPSLIFKMPGNLIDPIILWKEGT